MNKENIISQAQLVNKLHSEKGLRVKDIALQLSIAPSKVCQLLRLVKVPEMVVDSYYAGTLTASHLITLSRLPNEEEIIAVFEKILQKNLTVAKTEDLVREKLYKIDSKGEVIGEKTRESIEDFFKSVDSNIKTVVRQTRIKASIAASVVGSRKQTTAILKRFVGELKKNNDQESG